MLMVYDHPVHHLLKWQRRSNMQVPVSPSWSAEPIIYFSKLFTVCKQLVGNRCLLFLSISSVQPIQYHYVVWPISSGLVHTSQCVHLVTMARYPNNYNLPLPTFNVGFWQLLDTRKECVQYGLWIDLCEALWGRDCEALPRIAVTCTKRALILRTLRVSLYCISPCGLYSFCIMISDTITWNTMT